MNNIEEDDIELAQFDLSKKKKKKRPSTIQPTNNNNENKEENQEENHEEEYKEEEYDYITLLDRIFTMVRENNPSLATRKKQIIPAPILLKAGKKTIWTNFSNTVSVLHRCMDHIQSYISYEMTTECSIDGNYRLLMKGKFSSKNLEPVLKKYIIEYVSCHMCRGHETSIIKDPLTRLSFLNCEMCKSRRSVEAIKKSTFRL